MYKSTLNDVKDRDYTVIGVVCSYKGAKEGGTDIRGALQSLEEEAHRLGASGIIGITIVSASTYYKDSQGNTWPDIIAYGTAIVFLT